VTKTYRLRGQTFGIVGWMVFLTVVTLPLTVQGDVGVIAAVVGSWVFALRCAWCSVRTDAQGVRSTSPLGAQTVTWSQIRSFSVGRSGIYPRVALAQLEGGEVLRLWAIQGANPATRPKAGAAERAVGELNEELLRRRGGA
jgi:Bacterial PH domain